MKYLAIIEQSTNNFSAYIPDVPGCIATGKTIPEVTENLKKALEMHLKGMEEDGEPLPVPLSEAHYIAI